jgi:hypothetical protein
MALSSAGVERKARLKLGPNRTACRVFEFNRWEQHGSPVVDYYQSASSRDAEGFRRG